MSKQEAPTCGRCGVYRHLHPTVRCARSRHSYWWDRHDAWRHLAARAWLLLDDRRRMTVVHWLWSRREHLCWCAFVDSTLLDYRRDDYECGCDVPLPVGIRRPDGQCYCPWPATDNAERMDA